MRKTIFQNFFFVFVFVSLLLLLNSCALTPEKILADYAKATSENNLAKPKSIFFKAKINQIPNVFKTNFGSNSNTSHPALRMIGMSVYCEFPNKIYVNNDAVVIASDRFYNEHKVADVQVIQTFDGQSGWEITNSPQVSNLNNTRQLLFFEVDKLKKITDSTSSSSILSKITKPKYLGEQTIDYNVIQPGFGSVVKKTTHVIETITNDGKKELLYFDVNDNLLLKMEETDLLTNDKVTTLLLNYKEFSNIKMASTIIITRTSANNSTNDSLIFEIEEFKFDATEPSRAFIKPALL